MVMKELLEVIMKRAREIQAEKQAKNHDDFLTAENLWFDAGIASRAMQYKNDGTFKRALNNIRHWIYELDDKKLIEAYVELERKEF